MTDPTTPAGAGSFGDRLGGRVEARSSQLVLGLDPDPARLWPRAIELADRAGAGESAALLAGAGESAGLLAGAGESAGLFAGAGESAGLFAGAGQSASARAGRAMASHCALAIEATAEHCVAVKLQVACFERLGAPGWVALQEAVNRAHDAGLLVIADAKRGDIDISAMAYAQAFLGATPSEYGPVEGLGADALTVNPLLGIDSLEPFVRVARQHAGGVFALVRTSNPGAADIQERTLADGGSVSDRLAAIVAELGAPGIGASGLSDVGAVVGATAPERLESLRELMPAAVFLLPGVGAQGGKVQDLAAAFAPGRAGGLIAASRAIIDAHRTRGGDPATAAAGEAARLRELAWELTS